MSSLVHLYDQNEKFPIYSLTITDDTCNIHLCYTLEDVIAQVIIDSISCLERDAVTEGYSYKCVASASTCLLREEEDLHLPQQYQWTVPLTLYADGIHWYAGLSNGAKDNSSISSRRANLRENQPLVSLDENFNFQEAAGCYPPDLIAKAAYAYHLNPQIAVGTEAIYFSFRRAVLLEYFLRGNRSALSFLSSLHL